MPNDAPLSDRVEKADRGSRELNSEIWAALTNGDFELFKAIVPDLHQWAIVKPYTTSLDAAATLVPEGWDWVASSCVNYSWVERKSDGFRASSDAATPILALCAAALKARGL